MFFFLQNRLINISVLITFVLITLSCSKVDPEDFKAGIDINNEERYIHVTALGVATSGENYSDAEAKRDAGLIAEVYAAEMLVEALQGVDIAGEISIRQLNFDESTIIQKIEAKLVDMKRIGETKYKKEDGSWVASVTLGLDKFALMDFSRKLTRDRELMNQAILIGTGEMGTSFTGIAIDLRHILGVPKLSSPLIVDQNGIELISIRDMDVEVIVNSKSFQIFSTTNQASQAENGVGKRPLKLVSVRLSDDGQSIILDAKYADMLNNLENKDELIKSGKVVLIIPN